MKNKLNKPLASVFLAFLLAVSFASISDAATFYLLPSSATTYEGDSIVVEVRMNTEGANINAVQAIVKFPPESIEAVDINKGNSVLSLWPEEPYFINEAGKAVFTGGLPQGFIGDGLIGTIIFRPKAIGQATVGFADNSQALLNDGQGTAAPVAFLEGVYEITPRPVGLPQIISITHPDQNRWFRSSTLHLHWDLIPGAEYSFALGQDLLAEPDEVADRPLEGELKWIGDMEYPNLKDGIYYFALKQKEAGEAWGPKVTFRAMVDATAPEPFEAKVGRDPATMEGKYFLSFAANDKASGVDYYEVFEGRKERFKPEIVGVWKKAKSPYVLDDQSLDSVIRIKAVDRAGNERIEEIAPVAKPLSVKLLAGLGVVILTVIVIVAIFIRKKKKEEK